MSDDLNGGFNGVVQFDIYGCPQGRGLKQSQDAANDAALRVSFAFLIDKLKNRGIGYSDASSESLSAGCAVMRANFHGVSEENFQSILTEICEPFEELSISSDVFGPQEEKRIIVEGQFFRPFNID